MSFVVWVLEHRKNKHFQGSPSRQVETSVWFSFSTLVFSETERVLSNWTKFEMALWIFAVLLLTVSYTASLTSIYIINCCKTIVKEFERGRV
ncbi:putative ionotropic glutamate receptor [Rosa chinensis]|uniref:Putative ionotropic glutamate receptor n=1 Tax=Rosa chinensis TaxID=74649 RepID=A0A2P6PZP3_ROSCH|nr:putative ionotropic glutamate receptor [Rosa chinensis]